MEKSSRYNPWADLGTRPHIVCDSWTLELSRGHGWWLPDVEGILLDRRLTRVQRRCALAHELIHVDAGDQQVSRLGPDGPRQARRQERRADQAAARKLVPIADLAAALVAHPHDMHTTAETLDVTIDVLLIRLQNLHPAELARVRANLAAVDPAA